MGILNNSDLTLNKSVVNLEKCFVDLHKTSGVDLAKHSARVAVVLDFSGSMRKLYKSGAVQRTLNRLVPLGLKFDDNGQLDIWLFHDGFRRLKSVNIQNFENYVEEIILKSCEKYGRTSYSPVIRDILTKYTVEEADPHPVFVIFITDGSNDDKINTNNIIKESSNYNIFIQFIGLGLDDDFEYLRRLDDLKGRKVDNTGFIEVADFDKLNDNELYDSLLEQYIEWLKITGYNNRR